MGSCIHFLYRKFVFFVGIFWVSLSTYFIPLLSFFRTSFFRKFKRNDISFEISSEENSEKDCDFVQAKPEFELVMDTEVESKRDSINFTDGFGQKESPEYNFTFKFPSYDEFSKRRREIGDFIRFEAEVVRFNPKVENPDTACGSFGDKFDDFMEINGEAKAIQEEVPDESAKIEAMAVTEEKGKAEETGEILLLFDEIHLPTEKDLFSMDSNSESTTSSPLRSVMSRLIDSHSDGFLSDGDFELIDGEKVELHDEISDLDESHSNDSSKESEDGEFDEGVRELEEAHFQNVGNLDTDFLSEKDFPGEKENSKLEETDSGKVDLKNLSDWDSGDSNKLETLWEHQELIEQLKMEMKKVRATGLPTILEESEESPKVLEDLKPWKIDERFQHADRMDELHKFYKSYRERMRKFDILNYQKMYAIGFLQLKDPLQAIPSEKTPVGSFFWENFSLCKRKKIGNDPMMKFIRELQSDLEVFYVGQMCLSWEILHWQYGKALELWESDPRGIRQFNEVASELQQFQVLVQRFMEDEPFHGPRVQNYVKSRCVLRNLLQVPVIREDGKDRKRAMKRRERGDHAITSDMLIEIMEECIRIFWRFVRADKDCSDVNCSDVIVKYKRGPQVELQDPADTDLLREVRANLQKKEKKLKDQLRSGNCILRRFRKREEDGSEQVLYFFSQVDMKLVARVLNMSRLTTNQLIWCRNKLTKISFVDRKICVEPSFLLFPC